MLTMLVHMSDPITFLGFSSCHWSLLNRAHLIMVSIVNTLAIRSHVERMLGVVHVRHGHVHDRRWSQRVLHRIEALIRLPGHLIIEISSSIGRSIVHFVFEELRVVLGGNVSVKLVVCR